MVSKKRGYLIAFKLSPELTPAERTKFFRSLYGYMDRSQYGKYHYRREGILAKLGYVSLIRGVFIVRKDNINKVIFFLRRKAEIEVREVRLTKKDSYKLYRKK